jgi:hypothetical protein
VSTTAQRFVFGPDEEFVRKWLCTAPPRGAIHHSRVLRSHEVLRGHDPLQQGCVALFESGEYEQAVEAFDAVLNLTPDEVGALYYKGTALWRSWAGTKRH